MSLNQTKLTREEWDNLERPITGTEMSIIKFIHKSINNIDEIINKSICLLDFMQIKDDNYHEYLFNKYYKKRIDKMNKKYSLTYKIDKIKNKNIKKADLIRINNYDKKIENESIDIFENILLDNIKKLLKNNNNHDKFAYYYYTILQLLNYKLKNINKYVYEYTNNIINLNKDNIEISSLLKDSYKIIERNKVLIKYKNIELYKHQKDIIKLFKDIKHDKLVLYQAPTATGKTLTPLALVNIKRIIFVCAAKHVGMQLAKCCISLEIPIAIAFNCEDMDDIRLHYYAAKDFSRNYKTGGIWKVDNSSGEKVEIMISDIKSYKYAMNYMCAFNDKSDIIWYWDEPTISLDYDNHPFHNIMKENWHDNIIPNIVLSSATLPNEDEIPNLINMYKHKFNDSSVYSIKSYEFNKTVPIVNKEGSYVLPHTMIDNINDLEKCINIIKKNKTFLRHMDMKEINKFIIYVNKNIKDIPKKLTLNHYFKNVNKLTVYNIKLYYLELLEYISIACPDKYIVIFNYFKSKNNIKYKSTIKITTDDAHTLTDGPTIFLTNDVNKLSSFYLKVSKIPDIEINKILDIINGNNKYVEILDKLLMQESILNENKDKNKSKHKGKNKNEIDNAKESIKDKDYNIKKKLREDIDLIKSKIKSIGLSKHYIPNTKQHMEKWINDVYTNAFTSDIPEEYIEDIVMLNIEPKWKILLLMGIGVFIENLNKSYLEIMKKLAYQQKLYLIMASPDYIYGTNYQFCHGYLSKEFYNMSREKIIQAMGRVGRHNNELDYTIRIRDNKIIDKLLLNDIDKPEINNMNKLFGI